MHLGRRDSREGGLFQPHPVRDYPGEMPRLLIGAYELGEQSGVLSVANLAHELCIRT